MAKRQKSAGQPQNPGRPRQNVAAQQADMPAQGGNGKAAADARMGAAGNVKKSSKNRAVKAAQKKRARGKAAGENTAAQADIRHSGTVLSRDAAESAGTPAGRRVNYSRVPSADAFNHVKRMPPPNLPGRAAPGAPGGAAPAAERRRQAGAAAGGQQGTVSGGGAAGRATAAGGAPAAAAQQKRQGARQAAEDAPAQAKQKKGRRAGASPENQPAKKKPRPRPSPAKRRRNRRIAAVAAMVVLIAAGVWFSINMLFKVAGFEVSGESPYTQEEIVAAFGGEVGDAMFSFSAGGTAREMEKTLPYLQQVTIRRRLPGTVVFEVTPAVEKYVLAYEGQYAVLSAERKVLQVTGQAPAGLIEIQGLAAPVAIPGQPLAQDEAAVAALSASAVASGADASVPAAPVNDSAAGDGAGAGDVAPDGVAPDGANGDDGGADGTDEPNGDAATNADDALPEDGAEPDADANPDGDGNADADANTGDVQDAQQPVADEPAAQVPEKKASGTLATLDYMLDTLDASGLTDITFVDVGDELDLRFGWQGRVTVKLGGKSGMERKMKAVTLLLTDPVQGAITEGDRGTLDASNYLVSGDIRFIAE